MKKSIIAVAGVVTMALATVPFTMTAQATPQAAPTAITKGKVLASSEALLSDKYKVGTLRIRRASGAPNVAEVTLQTKKSIALKDKVIIPFVYKTQTWKPLQQVYWNDPKYFDFSGRWVLFVGSSNPTINGCIIDEGILDHNDYYKETRLRDGTDRQFSRRFSTKDRLYAFVSQTWTPGGKAPLKTNRPGTAAQRTWDDFVMINHKKGTPVPTARKCGRTGSW